MLSKILDKGMKVIDINKIISYRYSHKSSFAFYKEHVKNLQKKNIIKTAGIIILFLVIVFGLIFTFLLIIESKKKEKLIRELKSLQNEVEEHSSTDRLTGLPNREIFFDRLSQIRLLSTRIKNLFAVFIMDIDAFKNINKEFGHELGDKVIIKVAERIRNCLRESDTLARTGSDEFFGILTNIQYPKDPGIVALRILESLEDPLEINKQKYKVTISIGISVFPINSQNNDELISKAHEAMIIAKRHGRNTYVFYKEKK